MIYTVELNYSDPATTKEWNAWYVTYLRQLVSLDELDTAQRFRAVENGTQFWEYLALYTVPNLAACDTDAYRAIGGGAMPAKRSTTRSLAAAMSIMGSPECRTCPRPIGYCCVRTPRKRSIWRYSVRTTYSRCRKPAGGCYQD